MSDRPTYPFIAAVAAKPGKQLLVRFRNGVTKLYDCKRILSLPAFESLRDDEVLFRRARADKHGYGVIWNDDLDLAESELWIGGKVVRERRGVYGNRGITEEPGQVCANEIRGKTMSQSIEYAKITGVIRTIRGCQVILDTDLATLYGVEVKRLNEQVKRNVRRFPEDFMFTLTAEEADAVQRLRSQIATLKRGQHRKYLPHAFTEHGAIMYDKLRPLLLPPPEPERPKIGFSVHESRVTYRTRRPSTRRR